MSKQSVGARRVGAWTVAALVAAAIGAAACSDILGGGGSRDATITFRAPRTSLALQSGDLATVSAVPIAGGGHTVDLQHVDVVFADVKLERQHASGEADSDEEDSDHRNDETFRAGATTVALPLDGTTTVSPFTAPLPVGTYDELQMTAEFVRVQGTIDGQAFDTTVPVHSKFSLHLDPPLVVASDVDRPNVTVLIDPTLWFKNADGSVVDPRQITLNATLAQTFRNRIRASFHALKDNNRDGEDSDSDGRH